MRLPEQGVSRQRDHHSLGTWLRTVHHTHWSQLFWRVRYQIERRQGVSRRATERWRWQTDQLPGLRADFPDIPLFHSPTPEVGESLHQLQQGIFSHLHEPRALGRDKTDWLLGPVAAGRLWAVTLQYHGWASELAELAGHTEEAGHLFLSYVSDWMTRCELETPGSRDLAWNAYAVATRLTWWIRSYRMLPRTFWQRSAAFEGAFLRSLWQQAAYLHDHLEWDLLANHLLRDAVGLAWAGRFFQEKQASAWLTTATELALAQAREQVLPDGGHFERSPMYHLHVMEDFLSLALLVEDVTAQHKLRETWRKMADYLAWMRHPDGGVPLFNDAALSAACEPARMLHLGESVISAPRCGGRHFPYTGMAVWQGEPWSVFFDVGAVGPDYQPGHAHADTLSLECSYQGVRLFVDPGTYAYDNDDRRRYDRSTASHNTVCMDGQDSSEVWHIFRVGRRAYPINVNIAFDAGGMHAEASHSGYNHLPGRPQHIRRLVVRDHAALLLTDQIVGSGKHLVQGGLLLAPEWTATAAGGGWMLSNGARRVRVTVRGPENLALSEERRPYHPEFGLEVITTRLCWQVETHLPIEIITNVEGG